MPEIVLSRLARSTEFSKTESPDPPERRRIQSGQAHRDPVLWCRCRLIERARSVIELCIDVGLEKAYKRRPFEAEVFWDG